MRPIRRPNAEVYRQVEGVLPATPVRTSGFLYPSARPAGDGQRDHLAVHDGAVEISIQLETVEELPLKAEGVAVTLGNPDKGVAPVTAQAQRTADDQWSVKMPASDAGRWNLGLGITLAPAAIVNIASPILIY